MLRLVVIYILSCSVGIAEEILIRTASQDSAPKFIVDTNGPVSGLCIEIIRAIERIDPRLQFIGVNEVLPFRRMEINLLAGKIDAFCGFSRTAQRESEYKFIDIPLYRVKYVVAKRREDSVEPKNFDDIRALGAGGVVMGLFGTADVDYLRKQGGLIIDDSGKTVGSMLQRLVRGRGRFVYYHDLGLVHAIRTEGLQGKVEILSIPFVVDSAHYFVMSKNATADKFIAIKSALEKLRDAGALQNIVIRYQMK